MTSNNPSARVSNGKSRIVILFLAIFSVPATTHALDQMQLDMNRALWDSHNISDYDFILSRSCFCSPMFIRPGLVMVRNDAISAVIDAVTHQPRSPQDFFTIDGAFDLIQQSLNAPDTIVTTEFDPQLGYPREFGFDIPQLADDEITYGISGLRIVPEPAASALSIITLALLTICPRARRRSLRAQQ